MATEHNPLLNAYPLPAFSAVEPAHAVSAIQTRIEQARACVREVASVTRPTWENVVAPLEAVHDALNRAWSPVRHLHATADTPAWREAHSECLTALTEYRTEVGQNELLHRAYRRIHESPDFSDLGVAQRKVIHNALRDFRLSGVALDLTDKRRFKELSADLSELSTRFSENVLDATQAWKKTVIAEGELSGLPIHVLKLTAENAHRSGKSGWLLTLDYPIYSAVMSYCENRGLRREMYTAYSTRASDQGPGQGEFDNSENIKRILDTRHELANLVGFANYAEYSLARKMADTPDQVMAFLEDLGSHSKTLAERELAELGVHARESLSLPTLEPWDIPFVSERLRQARYAVNQEQLRPYFPVSAALDGLFEIVYRLFQIKVTESHAAETWHADVRFFRLTALDGSELGHFYLDAFSRKGKRGGAWMDECVVRRVTENGLQLPVAYLSCNFSPPINDQPSLLTHEEVCTLFHEFGHGLHHLLTKVDVAAVSGINGVPWDAVELPSQFLENWCWIPEGLALISAHVDTAEALPSDLIERLLTARNFLAGMAMMRQLEFGLFDLRIHAEHSLEKPRSVTEVLDEIRHEMAVVIPPDWHRFPQAFTHIFSGGYAAGYYSYKWAEVLAADAFDRFLEKGVFDSKCGRKFREAILETGGSDDALALFRRFRGRDPDVYALLKQSGIVYSHHGDVNEQ